MVANKIVLLKIEDIVVKVSSNKLNNMYSV